MSWWHTLRGRFQAPASPLRCAPCQASTVGRKAKQEDDCLVRQDRGDTLVLVADGVGGHGHGEFASKFVCMYFADAFANGDRSDPARFLRQTCLEAARGVLRQGEQHAEYRNCGTTLTGFFVRGEEFWTLNIGDSRVYQVSPQGVWQLTTDHQSAPGSRIMSYAIGQPLEMMQDHIDVLPPDPDNKLQPGTRLVALSDGAYEPFSTERFESLLAELPPGPDYATTLVKAAYDHQSRDNITCCAYFH